MSKIHVPVCLVLLLLAISGRTIAAQTDWVWWEGEAARESSFGGGTWLSGARLAKRDELSGGDWLTFSQKLGKEAPSASWRVEIPGAAEWGLWCRKFWKHGPFRWRFDRGAWQTCGRDVVLLDSVPLQKHVVANWVKLGEQRLSKGSHDFEIQLVGAAGAQVSAAFDCFVLSRSGFQPRGKLKPGARSGRVQDGAWAFEPPADREGGALDLRSLNEAVAGSKGWVRRRGDRLQRGDGKRIRFWGVNLGMETLRQSAEGQRRLARRLSRRGVNLVRVHGNFVKAGQLEEIDPARLAALQGMVAACKEQGIYVALSFYFPLWLGLDKANGWPEYEGMKEGHPFGLLFVEERFRDLHRGWMKQLLRGKGESGPLAEEPALAIVEIQNEDSLLFWTFKPGTVPDQVWKRFERRFGTWIGKRYGGFDKAYEVWGGARRKADDPQKRRMVLMPPWNLTEKGRGKGAMRARMSDQLRFLVEVQHGYYEETVAWMRKELGVKALISCSNWHTAEPRTLQPLERWTYLAGDLIDAHGYFGGLHQGPASSYAVRVGDRFVDRSALRDATGLPLLQVRPADRPFWMSEIGWPDPNAYKVEFPFLAATLASRQDFSGLCFFALHGSGSWESSVEKFPLAVPSLLGQFPGFALLYRRGDLSTPKPSLVEELSLEKLYDFGGSLLARRPALDELRKSGVPIDEAGADRSLPPQWLGPVLWKTVRRPSGIHDRKGLGYDENRFEDPDSGEILSMDRKRGLLLLDCPRAQGVLGFLAGCGIQELGDVAFECDNEFASLLAISLDGKPLRGSRRILIQMGTRERPHGWKVQDGRIQDLGGPPMQVERLRATLHLPDRGTTWKATALDTSGHRKQGRQVEDKMRLPEDALYLLLER